MARFLIRNNRPRRMLRIDGRVLRARNPYLGRTAGEMWVDGDRFTSRQITNLLRLKRVVVVEVEGVDQEALDRYFNDYLFVEDFTLHPSKGLEILGLLPTTLAPPLTEEPDPEPEVEVIHEPEPEELEPEEAPEPELAPEPDVPLQVEEPSAAPLPEVAEPLPAPEEPQDDTSGPDTLEELEAMSYRDLQGLAGDLGLAANGKKAELVQRIYDYQHGDS